MESRHFSKDTAVKSINPERVTCQGQLLKGTEGGKNKSKFILIGET